MTRGRRRGVRAEDVAAYNHVYLLGQAGQVQGFFAGGVSAAHNGYGAFAVEEPVAGGAGAHAGSFEFFLRGEAQIACLGTGGDDEGVCLNDRFCIYRDAERTPAQLYGCGDPLADIGPEIAGLVTHVVHKGGASAQDKGFNVFHSFYFSSVVV